MSDRRAALAMEASDERFKKWMRANITRAASHFGLTINESPKFGWRFRTISAPALEASGTMRWLRVVSEYPRWAIGDRWTGNFDANYLTGLAKPLVLDVSEWEEDGRRQRAELMTHCPSQPVSSTDVLSDTVELSTDWWNELRSNLTQLGSVSTRRVHIGQELVNERAEDAFGIDLHVDSWQTSRVASGASFGKIRELVLPATSPFGLDQGRLADASSHPF